MRKKGSNNISGRSKRVRGGAVPTRRAMILRAMRIRSSSRRRSTGRQSASTSALMSKKMLIISKYVTILNKLVKSNAIKKNDPVAGYILVPFVDSYIDTTKDSRAASQSQSLRRRGGAGPARAASIADESDSQTLDERDLVDLLTRHGRAVLGFRGPCWWHRINHYERLLSLRKCKSHRAAQLRKNAVIEFLCSLPQARGSRPFAEACMQAAGDDQDLAFRYLETGIPASRTASASASKLPAQVASILPPECLGQVYIGRGSRFEYTNLPGELSRAMDYFAQQYQSYCPLVDKPVPGRLTGSNVSQIVSKALEDASMRPPTTEQFRIPAHFDSPDTRLTFCEYAAIFFFTRVSDMAFSSYLLLNNSIDYRSVKDLSAVEYVQRIRHPFVMLFYFALYKCPRIRDIRRAGLIPHGMRHLHRFMVVNASIFQTYRDLPVQNMVTFYSFQSFSFTLAYGNIGPFTNPVPHEDKFHIILLRIELNDATSARLMSHFSELIHENEAIVTPCVPYTVVNVQEFQGIDQDGFKQEIRAGSEFDYGYPFDPQIRGFLVVTIREEKYKESMSGQVHALRG